MNIKTFKVGLNRVLHRICEKIKSIVRTLFSNKKVSIGTIIMLFFILMAIFGRMIFDYNPITDEQNKFLPPSWEHWLGTDNLGRDTFTQLMYGARDVLSIALLTSIFSVFIGTTLGMISGFVGGVTDKFIQIITNLFLSIPSFPIILILAAFITIEDALSFALILSLWNWAGLCRAVRSQIMSLKERDFIQICVVMNLSKKHILFSELIPNIASYVLINFILIMRNAITGSVGIMMLGLAAFQPSNWGAILLRARDIGGLLIPEAIYFVMSPIIAIMLFQMGAILLANGLDEALNPRLRSN
jgi:peptide/nickel transport system permease protein